VLGVVLQKLQGETSQPIGNAQRAATHLSLTSPKQRTCSSEVRERWVAESVEDGMGQKRKGVRKEKRQKVKEENEKEERKKRGLWVSVVRWE
jgi:hypothetical protein